MNILSIQSHVVYGRVGNRVSVFALERMGHEVWPINTVQFSSHAGKKGYTGMAFGAEHIHELILGLESLKVLSACDAVLSGYIGDSDTGMAICEAVAKVKRARPEAIYCCDPVMGDYPEGMYVKPALQEFFIKEALAMADIVMPNVFEAELLSGIKIIDKPSAQKAVLAIKDLGPKIVIISSYKDKSNNTGFLASDDKEILKILSPSLAFKKPPKGSGDLSSALFLGYYLKEKNMAKALELTISALYCVLKASMATIDGIEQDYLSLISAQEAIEKPHGHFLAEKF